MVSPTDVLAVGYLTAEPTPALLAAAAQLAAELDGEHFTTALSDSERRYLDIMAELFARGALPWGGGCVPGGCGGRCSCTGCLIRRVDAP